MKRVTMLLAAGLVLLAAQQATVTSDNLDQMIENAKTPADPRPSPNITTNRRLRMMSRLSCIRNRLRHTPQTLVYQLCKCIAAD